MGVTGCGLLAGGGELLRARVQSAESVIACCIAAQGQQPPLVER